ncbi:winged helix DNA-binding domain-containing protein [Streptomyces triticagri]|uniref:Winged helix DNA-binding domain-containing protein n=1 Tax=Streptomyces triticagri TaxID=2293568 RepID=A0A372LWQ0_9ACTN|nr:crosslink repair DNA glycosylase YcaQ family protein [Streptomyces triticagri]RFU82969.1 winged helix DNA-binding domain-containing protein [Streptomyces triticagri]
MSSRPRPEVTREQILAHRVAAQGLDRASTTPDVLALGVQDTPNGSARLAFAARGVAPDEVPGGLDRVWSFRGAPHIHRRNDLRALAAALWPVSDADATARLASVQLKRGSALGVEAFAVTARAFRDVVTTPMPKGEVSTAVSAAVPEVLTFWCEPCGARHISGQLFQQAGLFAALEVGVTGRQTVLAPLHDRFPVPVAAAGTSELVRRLLGFLGPAAPAEVAALLGTKPAVVESLWPDGLAEVAVDGRRAWLPEGSLAGLRTAEPGSLVRLLPPGDPFLQARDRALLLPDPAHRKELWRPVSAPGALLVGAEIAGTWRVKAAGRRAAVTVAPFAPLRARVRKALEAEAATVAEARGATGATLDIAS